MDRIAICEVYYLLESDYNVSGVLQERKSNARRKMSTAYQLARMEFKPSPLLSLDTLDQEQRELYATKVLEYFGSSVATLDMLGDDYAFCSDSQDVIPLLADVGVLPAGVTEDSREWWLDSPYNSVFMWRGVIFGVWGIIPYTHKSVEILGSIEQ